jgi:hypothetical protein
LSEAGGPPLSLLASTRGGLDVAPRDLTSLEHHLRTTVSSQTAVAVRHPMRSALWVWPFAASLSAEWWLRRRPWIPLSGPAGAPADSSNHWIELTLD